MSARQHVELKHLTVFPGESLHLTLWGGRSADSETVQLWIEVDEDGNAVLLASEMKVDARKKLEAPSPTKGGPTPHDRSEDDG